MLLLRNFPAILRVVHILGASALLLLSIILLFIVRSDGILSVTMGNWLPPFGISFVADLFSASLLVISGIIALATSIYSISNEDVRIKHPFFYPLLHILLMGVNGSFLTGDMFNLYVWFEVMLIASFVLLAMGGKQEQLEGSIKYVVLNLLSSAIFLAAVGILFGIAGTLNMADLSQQLGKLENNGLITVVAMMFLVSFGIKSAIFPLFFWLPASYHTPPVTVSAIFAGLLTKVGVYSLYRVFTLIFTQNEEFTSTLLIVLGCLTMITGVLGPLIQNDFRRILSFHIVSQVGYMILALGIKSPAALAAGMFYMLYHILTKSNLFFISGITERIKGTYDLKLLGGLFKAHPFVSILFLLNALALAGIPPLSGFWAKLSVAIAGFKSGEYIAVGIALFVGLLTLFSMTKIWNMSFWTDDERGNDFVTDSYRDMSESKKYMLYAPVILMTVISLTMAFGYEWYFQLMNEAAAQLSDPTMYYEAVFGAKP
jgi:multicomponent Na+:H+ antiporter subunit D